MITGIKEKMIGGSERSSLVKKNVIASLVIKGVSMFITYALVPISLHYVSSELYGIWLTLSSIAIWLGFFDIGFTLGLKNKLTEAIALEDYNKGRKLVSTTYYVMFLIFVPLLFVIEFLLPYIDWCGILNVSNDHADDILKTIRIVAACFCFQMILNVFSTVAASFQHVALSSLLNVLENFISLVVIYIFTKSLPPSLYNLSLAISFSPIIVLTVASIIGFSSRYKAVSPRIHCIDNSFIRNIFDLGLRFFIIQIQVIVFYQTTNFLISNISGPLFVTSYNIAYKYVSIIMLFFTILLTPLWPAFTDAFIKNDYSWMKSVYTKLCRTFCVCVAVLVLLVVLSPTIYKLWLGEDGYVPAAMTAIVAFYIVVQSWMSLHVTLINGIGFIKLQTYVTLIGLICHIPLSFLLGKTMGLGAYGVITSMIVIDVIYAAFFTTQLRRIISKTAIGIWSK